MVPTKAQAQGDVKRVRVWKQQIKKTHWNVSPTRMIVG